jgi:hypothetical protein
MRTNGENRSEPNYRCFPNGRATEQANAVAVPFVGRHAVDADVVRIGEVIESVWLYFRETQCCIAFCACGESLPGSSFIEMTHELPLFGLKFISPSPDELG